MASKRRIHEPAGTDIVPAKFQAWVDEALKTLRKSGDPLFLGQSPLALLLLLGPSAGERASTSHHQRGENLQQLLRSTLETLRPPDHEPVVNSPQNLAYLILRDYYFDQRDTAVHRLASKYGLSVRAFYYAVETGRVALADRLWGQLAGYVQRGSFSSETWQALEILTVFETGTSLAIAERLLSAAGVPNPHEVVGELYRRHLLGGTQSDALLLAEPVRLVVYQSLPPGRLGAYHRLAAETCQAAGNVLAAARHFRLTDDHTTAARVVIPHVDLLIARGQGQGLLGELRKIDSRRLPDSEQVELLVARGKGHAAIGEWDEAITCFNQAIPQLEHDRQVWAAVQHHLGKICERQGEYEQAAYHYREAMTALDGDPPSEDQLRLWALVQKDRAMLHNLQGEPERALELCQAALQTLGTALGFDIERAELFKAQGTIYRNQGAYADAIACYQRAGDFASAGNHVGLQGEAYEGLGIVYDDQGKYLAALDHYERALALYEQMGNQFFVTRVMGNISVTHFQRGAHDQAITVLEDVLRVFRRIGDPQGMVRTYTNMAEARLRQVRQSERQVSHNHLIQASDYAQHAVEICSEKLGETADVMPDALYVLADVYVAMAEMGTPLPEEVPKLVRRALRLVRKTGNRYGEGFVRMTWGRTLWVQGKYRAAGREYVRARDIFAQLGNQEQVRELNTILMVTRGRDRMEERH